MEPEVLITLGTFCETVLRDPNFQHICTEFEKTTCQQMLATAPAQAKDREEIFATFNGAKVFLSFMADFVTQKDKLLSEVTSEPLDEDDII